MFERLSIPSRVLPIGCHVISLHSCPAGKNVDIVLSSTSPWYTEGVNGSTKLTQGIVFAEVNALSIPVSLFGMAVDETQNSFSFHFSRPNYTGLNLQQTGTLRKGDCLSFDFTVYDLLEFLGSNTFLSSFFSSIDKVLPSWLRMSSGNKIDFKDVKADIVEGRYVDDIYECRGAPLFQDHYYSVFIMGSNFSVSVFDETVSLPKSLGPNKFCLIVDICQHNGGSLFLMVPEDQRNILGRFNILKSFNNVVGLRGLGLSIANGINVAHTASSLTYWNGDQLFDYRLDLVFT